MDIGFYKVDTSIVLTPIVWTLFVRTLKLWRIYLISHFYNLGLYLYLKVYKNLEKNNFQQDQLKKEK